MREFNELWAGGPVFAQAEHFRLSTDSVLLADFVNINGARRGIDLGCASGIAALLLLCRSEKLHMTGLELLPAAAELARENMARNALDGRSEMLCGDIREHRRLFRTGAFDLVVANPPYFTLGSGALSPDRDRAGARGEMNCTLEDVCAAAAYLCRTGGSFCMVYRPERLTDALVCMRRYALEPKRLRFVCHRADSAPSLVLLEGRRGGKPGLTVEKNLVLHEPDGGETDEVKRMYHRDSCADHE